MSVAARIALAWLLVTGSAASAGEIVFGSGSTVALGSAVIDAGCHDLDVDGSLSAESALLDQVRHLTISGQLDAEDSTLGVRGDWINAGSFDEGNSAVALSDGCGVATSSLTGDNTFNDFEMSTGSGKTYSVQAGSTQTFTGAFDVYGAAQRLKLRSSVSGVAVDFDVQSAGATGNQVDVKDNHLIGETVLLSQGSVLSGNTIGWMVVAAVPGLLPLAALGLLAAIVSSAHRRLDPRA